MRSRAFLLAGLAVTLLLAGVASHYASTSPDGLEHVAEEVGVGHAAEESPLRDSPLADYTTDGVDDDRVGGGVAGIAGSVLVLVLAGGLFRVLRRRPRTGDRDHADGGA